MSATLAGEFGVTPRTIRTWMAKGMPSDPTGARAWHAVNVNPKPRKGGKQPGAGRPKGSATDGAPSVPIAPSDTPPPASSRAERMGRLATGDCTRAEIDLTNEETRALDRIRESDKDAGKLLAVEDTAQAWGELLQAHKSDLDGLAARVETKAGAELRLTPEQGRALRGIVAGEVEEMCKRLVDGGTSDASDRSARS